MKAKAKVKRMLTKDELFALGTQYPVDSLPRKLMTAIRNADVNEAGTILRNIYNVTADYEQLLKGMSAIEQIAGGQFDSCSVVIDDVHVM